MNILLVEDTMETVQLLESALKKEGFVVDTAMDGTSGSYKALTNEYDLLILDIGLPGKDGRDICREVRAAGKSVPILMLSVEGAVATKVELLDIGADDYLSKPFFFEELLARAKALLRRPRELEKKILQVGDLVVDTTSHAVRCGEKEVSLTLKEFSLLEYLIRNRGRVLTRMEILEHVWDVNADPFTNTVETHIGNIRRKIGQSKEEGIIHTVSGVGYEIR
jgi:DNA-binding response OmpR family regulator